MKDYYGIIATIAKGSTAGQLVLMDATCTNGDNTFDYFEINHQSPWNNTLTLKIFEGKNFTGNPIYVQSGITTNKASANTKLRIDLEGGQGSLGFTPGQKYTFTLTPEDAHFRWNGDRRSPSTTNEALWPNNGGKWSGNFDYFYKIGTKNDQSAPSPTENQLTAFYTSYGGKNNFTPHYQDAIETFLNAEDKVKAGDYAGAEALLDQLWAQYPISNDKANNIWESIGMDANGSWTGAPPAYAGLRMLTSIVNHHTNNPYPNYQPHDLNMKVILVGKTSGTMPKNSNDIASGGGVAHTSVLDTRVKENNYQKLKDVLYIFNEYISACTDGRLKINMEFIELSSVEFTPEIVPSASNRHSIGINPNTGGPTAALASLSQNVKDDADMYWIIYPSFTPGTGPQNEAVASHTEFPGKEFITGGMDNAINKTVFFSDDLFFLDRQPKFSKRTFTEVERRCYAPQWFQHEYFHDLYDIFPTFPNEPNGLESESHIWHKRFDPTPKPWPLDFGGIYEADYFQESMYKRIKQVTDNPIHKRLVMRKITMPSSVLNLMTNADLLGEYLNEQETNPNGYERGEIVDNGNGTYKWATVNDEPCVPDLPNGIVNINNTDFQILLKVDENTGEYLPEVLGLKVNNAVFTKQ